MKLKMDYYKATPSVNEVHNELLQLESTLLHILRITTAGDDEYKKREFALDASALYQNFMTVFIDSMPRRVRNDYENWRANKEAPKNGKSTRVTREQMFQFVRSTHLQMHAVRAGATAPAKPSRESNGALLAALNNGRSTTTVANVVKTRHTTPVPRH